MLKWVVKPFSDLTPQELYSCLMLRNAVFIVQQDCAYQDIDGRDAQCMHIMGWQQDKLVTYTRILPPGLIYAEVSFGRVVTDPSVRRTGVGRQLLERVFQTIQEYYGLVPVRISAQSYLQGFYESYGFEQVSEEYLEDNIPHIEMLCHQRKSVNLTKPATKTFKL